MEVARACKRSRVAAVKAATKKTTATGASPLVDAELQVAASWLPGRVANAHVHVIAKYLVGAVSSVAGACGLMTDAAAALAGQLGKTFSAKFVRGSKSNVANILLEKQRQWLGSWAPCLQAGSHESLSDSHSDSHSQSQSHSRESGRCSVRQKLLIVVLIKLEPSRSSTQQCRRGCGMKRTGLIPISTSHFLARNRWRPMERGTLVAQDCLCYWPASPSAGHFLKRALRT